MYNFIFWFFYKYFEWKDKDDSTFIPSTLVSISIISHLGLLYAIYKAISGLNPLEWGVDLSYGQRKVIYLPLVALLFTIVWYFYYKKHAKSILTKYEGKKPFTIRNIIYVLLIIAMPIIIIAKLS